MHTATLHANASAYWIDTIIVTLDSNLCTLTRHTGNTTNGNQTILNLRNLCFKHTLQELVRGTRDDNAWIVVLVLHLLNNGTDGLTFTIVVSRNLLTLWQVELVTLIIDEQHFALPHLINLSTDNLANLVLILLVE